MTANELKPCPFCGGNAEQQNYVVEAVVHCTSCYAVIRRVHARDVDTGIDASASAWNTRAPQWQPIESAPRDGTRVLTCFHGVDYQINTFTNHDHTAPGYRIGRDKTWWNSPPNRQPTHWLALPEPPKEVE